jgi:uncharacterized delta-60 repeat protein
VDPIDDLSCSWRLGAAVFAVILLLAPPFAHAQTRTADVFNLGTNGAAYSLALQADGKILVGGWFSLMAGQTRENICRLYPDGTLDATFNPGADDSIFCMAVQEDGKILVGGGFGTLGGQRRSRIARLNPDGTLDHGFDPKADNWVKSLAVQADGKILVGGFFTSLDGEARSYIARLNPDGTLDTEFDPGANSYVCSMAMQSDGRILVGGAFTTLGGQPRSRIARLNPDGTLDTGFNPGANSIVRSVALQADGKILLGGSFATLSGQARSCIGRLNPDGTPDTAFDPGASFPVGSLALQADGKILVGGWFTELGGEPCRCLGRLNPDGTLDTSFDPGAEDDHYQDVQYVYSLALQADGRVLSGRVVAPFPRDSRGSIARFNATAPATQSLSYNGSTITWLRGGTSPEAWRTVFDWSSDGLLWTPLGEGVRVPGGWQRISAIVPAQATIRARGFVAGGYQNAGNWFAEGYSGPPVWVAQPAIQTNDVGSTASLGGVAGGTPPLAYQWFKGGAAVKDDGRITGATTASLTLTNVQWSDAGGYYLVVSNAYGARTSVVAMLTVNDPVITLPPVGMNRDPGESATLSVTAQGTTPLSYQWWKDGVALAGRTDSSLALTNLAVADGGTYWVVVSGPHGSATSGVAWLTVSEVMLDPGFDPGMGGDYPSVSSLAVQADGKILVGGSFTSLGGQARNRIARLNPDGTLDTGFDPGTGGDPPSVSSLAVQADGKILVGGSFTSLGGQARDSIGRLNSDGTLDAGFNPGASNSVYSLAVQPDGKILVGGRFTSLGGQARNYIGRLNPDGTLDAGFNPGAGGGWFPSVSSLAVQPDGKILVGGDFTILGGQARNYIGRLNPDGTLDSGFDPKADKWVNSLAVQADGKILVGGYFRSLGGQARNCIGRLNSDGTLDTKFNPGAGTSTLSFVESLAVQADGKILVGGGFTNLSGQTRNRIARLNSDGTLDTGFNPGANGPVYSLAVQADGRILVGGDFTTLGGQARNGIGRLNATAPATQSLTYDNSRITWLRGGTSPEVWRTVFDWSSDGLLWTPLGEGVRVPGGWQQDNAVVPSQATFLRARGFVAGDCGDASGWFVESYRGPLVWISQPVSRTNDFGSNATLGGLVNGTTPAYQWFKDGTALTDSAHVTGATTAWLTLVDVLGSDTGSYHLVVSNAYGARTSVVATLTVNDPAITMPPVSKNPGQGGNATMNVTARGTAPLSYQWWKDGVAMAGRTESSITLTNVSVADAGGYWVVVSGHYGSATSRVAWLSVNEVTLDSGFNPGVDTNYPYIYSLAVQTDGKILVGGHFSTLGGQTRSNIARLNPDGALDISFNPGVGGGSHPSVSSFAVQGDGKILVGGDFSTLGGYTRGSIGRLNPDGTLDNSFNPGADGYVACLAVQTDGKILVGGGFTITNGQPRNWIARLDPDGALDTGFNPQAGVDYPLVSSLAVQTDGKILVGGEFTMMNGQPRSWIARLNSDGTLDVDFNPAASGDYVCSLALQADGKILLGGGGNTLGGQPCDLIGRLNLDGTLDTSFNLGAKAYSWDVVTSLAVQADGKILAGGRFTTLRGQAWDSIARLNPDGTPDLGFNPVAGTNDIFVRSLAVQADGKILVGGQFSTLGGQTRASIARLNTIVPATQSLTYDSSRITWLRGGTSPEVWRTTLEYSTNGVEWVNLGAGMRIPGGWQSTEVSIPTNSIVRARGHIAGGYNNGSSWFVESLLTIGNPRVAPTLSVESVNGESMWFKVAGGTNAQYEVQTATNLPSAGEWQPVTTLTLTNGWGRFDWTNTGDARRFFRAK